MFTEGRLLLERVLGVARPEGPAAAERRRPAGRDRRPRPTPSGPPAARLAVLESPDVGRRPRRPPDARAAHRRGPLPGVRRPPARALQQLVRVLPALRGRHQGPEDRQGHQRHLPDRRQAAGRGRRDGLRRDLPAADPPDRRGQPQGAEQHPRPRPRRPRLAVGDRLEGRRPRRDPPRPRHVRGLRRVRRPGPLARPRGRARPRPPGRARPPVGRPRTPSGSPPARTAPSPTPRTRRRSTRTSTRSTSTTTRAASARRSCGSSGSGCRTASGSSASTTRTPSRWRSGSGCSRRSGAPTPTCCSSPRRSPARR